MIQDRYYTARAAEEREIAMASANLTVRSIHLELAGRYEALVEGSDRARLQMEEESEKPASLNLLPRRCGRPGDHSVLQAAPLARQHFPG